MPGLLDALPGRNFQVIPPGFELRDWFAGMALSGALASGSMETEHELAQSAYTLADAMLKARDKREPRED